MPLHTGTASSGVPAPSVSPGVIGSDGVLGGLPGRLPIGVLIGVRVGVAPRECVGVAPLDLGTYFDILSRPFARPAEKKLMAPMRVMSPAATCKQLAELDEKSS